MQLISNRHSPCWHPVLWSHSSSWQPSQRRLKGLFVTNGSYYVFTFQGTHELELNVRCLQLFQKIPSLPVAFTCSLCFVFWVLFLLMPQSEIDFSALDQSAVTSGYPSHQCLLLLFFQWMNLRISGRNPQIQELFICNNFYSSINFTQVYWSFFSEKYILVMPSGTFHQYPIHQQLLAVL